MPRPGPRRPLIALRLSLEGIAYVDQRARDEGIVVGDEPNRSELIRIMIAYAAANMPKNWRPPKRSS